MRILLDHRTPAPLRYALKTHVVVEAFERRWERLANGSLLDAAESAGFELLITADKSLRLSAKPGTAKDHDYRAGKRAVAHIAAPCR